MEARDLMALREHRALAVGSTSYVLSTRLEVLQPHPTEVAVGYAWSPLGDGKIGARAGAVGLPIPSGDPLLVFVDRAQGRRTTIFAPGPQGLSSFILAAQRAPGETSLWVHVVAAVKGGTWSEAEWLGEGVMYFSSPEEVTVKRRGRLLPPGHPKARWFIP